MIMTLGAMCLLLNMVLQVMTGCQAPSGSGPSDVTIERVILWGLGATAVAGIVWLALHWKVVADRAKTRIVGIV